MIIHYQPENQIWVADSERSDGPTLKSAGFRWHPFANSGRPCTSRNCPACAAKLNGKWWTAEKAVVCKLAAYGDDIVKQQCVGVELKKDAELVVSYNPEHKIWFAVSERQHTPVLKEAGWTWEPFANSERPCIRKNCQAEAAGVQGKWWTADRTQACRLGQYADAAAAPTCQAQKEAIEASLASTVDPSTVVIPVPPGLSYRPYQLAGISYALARKNSLNGDDPGLGKSIQTMGVINGDPTIRKVLIVGPASLRLNWAREASKWSVRPIRITVIDEVTKITSDHKAPQVEMTIINYDRLLDTTGSGLRRRIAADKASLAVLKAGPRRLELAEKSPENPRKKVKVVYTPTHPDWTQLLSRETERLSKAIPELEARLREHKPVFDDLMAQDWDLLVADEAQAIKTPDAARTIAVLGDEKESPPTLGLISKSRRFLALTGTPIENRPMELWGLAHALDPLTFNNFFAYGKRYCGAKQVDAGRKMVWDFSGASNLSELREKLRSTIMVRRLKGDVLKELPAKQRELVVLPADTEELRAALRLESSLAHLPQQQAEAEADLIIAEAMDDAAAYKAAVAKLTAVGIAFETASKDRQALAMAKLEASVAYIDGLLAGGIRKIAVWAHHKAVLEELLRHFGSRAVLLYGDTKLVDRQAAVDRFQTDPSCEVFIGGIRAAGVGWTLTAAADEVFVEMDWAPSKMVQAEDRLHRIGQTLKVHVRYLAVDGSLDATMAQMLIEKQAIADAALDDPTNTALIVPPAPTLDPNAPMPAFGAPRTASVRRGGELIPGGEAYDSEGRRLSSGDVGAAPPEDVDPVSDEMKALAMKAMQIVVGYCDGARRKDEVGFSACDAALGKRLAYMGEYTDRVAHLAIKLARKYRRQLPQDLVDALGIGEGMKPARRPVEEMGADAPVASSATAPPASTLKERVEGLKKEADQAYVPRASTGKFWIDNHPAPPCEESGYADADAFDREIREQYIGTGVSSRTTPAQFKMPALGTWTIDTYAGLHGHEIQVLAEVPVADLAASEDTFNMGRGADVEQYAEWALEGKQAPPIAVLETDKGTLKVSDGHRRFYAAKAAGKPTILAWVAPTGPHPEGLVEYGKTEPMRVGLTFEMAQKLFCPPGTTPPPPTEAATSFPDAPPAVQVETPETPPEDIAGRALTPALVETIVEEALEETRPPQPVEPVTTLPTEVQSDAAFESPDPFPRSAPVAPEPRRMSAYSPQVIEAARLLMLPAKRLAEAGKAWQRSAARDPVQGTMFAKNDTPQESWGVFLKAAGISRSVMVPPEHVEPVAVPEPGPQAPPGYLLVFQDGTRSLAVPTLSDAAVATRAVAKTMGGEEWYATGPRVGDVYDDAGDLVARISYNGRAWEPGIRGQRTAEIPLQEPAAVQAAEVAEQVQEEVQAAEPPPEEVQQEQEEASTLEADAQEVAEAPVTEAPEAAEPVEQAPSDFISEVRQIATGVGAAGRLGLNRVYLSALYAAWPGAATESKEQFFERIREAAEGGAFRLSTVAMTGAVDKVKFQESALVSGGETYHFLND